MYDDQAAVDAAFADLAHLLDRTDSRSHQSLGCHSCGSFELDAVLTLVSACITALWPSCGLCSQMVGQDDAAYYPCHKSTQLQTHPPLA